MSRVSRLASPLQVNALLLTCAQVTIRANEIEAGKVQFRQKVAERLNVSDSNLVTVTYTTAPYGTAANPAGNGGEVVNTQVGLPA
jgi:hypothetical protein